MDKWRVTLNTEDVRECPFCASKSISVCHAKVKFLGQNDFGVVKQKMKVYCKCNKCHSRGTPVAYIGYENRGGYDEEHRYIYDDFFKYDAIAKWNKRTVLDWGNEYEHL